MLKAEGLKKTLLIIDNSLFIIERLISILKDVENLEKITWAANYIEALDRLKNEQPDIVLLDIQLYEKNGIELLKYIVDQHVSTKVIVLSNLVSIYYQDLCKSLGAAYYIDKSIDFEKISEIVASL